jgi:hypothetical protein
VLAGARIWLTPDILLVVVEVPVMNPEVAILIQVKVFLRMDGARSSTN